MGTGDRIYELRIQGEEEVMRSASLPAGAPVIPSLTDRQLVGFFETETIRLG
jgi:hypothetical protein